MQVKNKTNKNSDQQVLKPNNAAVFTYRCSFNPSLHLRDCFILYRKLCSLVYNGFKQAQNTRIRENLNLFSRICVFSPSAHQKVKYKVSLQFHFDCCLAFFKRNVHSYSKCSLSKYLSKYSLYDLFVPLSNLYVRTLHQHRCFPIKHPGLNFDY